jgi:hypothetical protein
VAEHLSHALGRGRVLYDAYWEAELARPDLDTYLQDLYHDESDLVAVFLCHDYRRKDWCGLEWRAVRDLTKRRQAEAIMPLRFDQTEIPGLFSIDGYVEIRDRTPEAIARLILDRLASMPDGSVRSADLSDGDPTDGAKPANPETTPDNPFDPWTPRRAPGLRRPPGHPAPAGSSPSQSSAQPAARPWAGAPPSTTS